MFSSFFCFFEEGRRESAPRLSLSLCPEAIASLFVFPLRKTIRALLLKIVLFDARNCAQEGSQTAPSLSGEAEAEVGPQTAANGAPFGGAAAEPSVVDCLWRGFSPFCCSFGATARGPLLGPVLPSSPIREQRDDRPGRALTRAEARAKFPSNCGGREEVAPHRRPWAKTKSMRCCFASEQRKEEKSSREARETSPRASRFRSFLRARATTITRRASKVARKGGKRGFQPSGGGGKGLGRKARRCHPLCLPSGPLFFVLVPLLR